MTSAVILCAGKGTRLLPLTENIPKPMIPLNGHPLLEYNVSLCKKNKVGEILINTSTLPEKIKSFFGDGSRFGTKIKYSFEENLLGTAGALINFKDSLTSDFFVIYGDNLTNLNLNEMLMKHKESKALATLFVYKFHVTDKTTTPGVVLMDENQKIKRIIERPTEEEKEMLKVIPDSEKYTNAGIYVLSPKIFDYIDKTPIDFSREVFPKAISSGELLIGHTSSCFYRELGSKERYFETEKELSENNLKLDLIDDED